MTTIKAISLVAMTLLGATAAKAGALDSYRTEKEINDHRVLEGAALDKTSRILGGNGSGRGTTTNPALSQVERTKSQVQSILNNRSTQANNSKADSEHQNTRRELDKLKSALNENNSRQNNPVGREEAHTTARSSKGTATSMETAGGKAVRRSESLVARRRSTH